MFFFADGLVGTGVKRFLPVPASAKGPNMVLFSTDIVLHRIAFMNELGTTPQGDFLCRIFCVGLFSIE